MAGRLTRFLNLERARKNDLTPEHGMVTKARFSDEPAPAAPPDEMFRAERAAQLESGIEVEQGPAGEQPFLRCPVCEADNSKYAARCINCQARLDTDQVREWNARLWAERQKQQAAPEPAPPPLAQLPPDQQRLLGEAIAQQVAQQERARMGWDGWGDSSPLGWRLLQLIPDANVRFGVAMALVATFFGSGLVAYLSKGHTMLQTGATIVAVALFAIFMPATRRRRRRWWDWDDF